MTSVELNAEIYEALSIIAKDESLLKKAAKSLKRLAAKKQEECLMSKDEFFAQIDCAREQIKDGNCKKMLKEESIDDFLVRNDHKNV